MRTQHDSHVNRYHCERHWARVRSTLPPFTFPLRPPVVSIEITSDEARDVAAFKAARQRVTTGSNHARR